MKIIKTLLATVLFSSFAVSGSLFFNIPNKAGTHGTIASAENVSNAPYETPIAPPSNLAAKNATLGPDIDSGRGDYRIELKWNDNSNNEDGFIVIRFHGRVSSDGFSGFDSVEFIPSGINAPPTGERSYTDTIAANVAMVGGEPSHVKGDMYCYIIGAYTREELAYWSKTDPAGAKNLRWVSSLSNPACSTYSFADAAADPSRYVDTDRDGYFDVADECPYEAANPGSLTGGCPDVDLDHVADKDDSCPVNWGDRTDGCPYKYSLRWIGMKILNNTRGGVYSEGREERLPSGRELPPGEEPYLIFSLFNGNFGGQRRTWVTRWCCGEGVIVEEGNDYEPDADGTAEEFPNRLNRIRDEGLIVFPEYGYERPNEAKFDEIDKTVGLVMTIALMERDWGAKVTPATTSSAIFENIKNIVSSVVSIGAGVYSCASGPGCLFTLGGAISNSVDTAYNNANQPQPSAVDDPDDLMGAHVGSNVFGSSSVWFITSDEARAMTWASGVYAFALPEIPRSYDVSCLGWEPCTPEISVPVAMRARVFMCLVREGTPESTIRESCPPPVDEASARKYELVLPWPMR